MISELGRNISAGVTETGRSIHNNLTETGEYAPSGPTTTTFARVEVSHVFTNSVSTILFTRSEV
jgi:hypothetical protein